MQAKVQYEDSGLLWMYGHLRRIGCSFPTALYRSTRFKLLGDTGDFRSAVSWQKIRFSRARAG
ncbi:hypothetical protein M8R19_09530 [Pseudomonas sp. R3.Fl]|uniref:hypothetical protein n=1 Tax=Pseudomonas TaxID=286 RepID=UPI00201E1F5D|nr:MULTISPECIES: hypothetical protein [Pseudomonas]MCL6688955.1 hypothetical protein [Pseudomonas sp. R3.Fl]MCP1605790.1 hypothetical protein [Pseudomonas citronellolis]MCP1642469.1 hypothetical protein [Pseudomonas citronellolis]MCP1656055.1 hypothetical protein [Pseudomonas citronellolis]MCP1665420.1 hypothetical protein [Pseudomonas citronellolis]